MCIAVFIWQAHPLYPFLLLFNREEYYSRRTEPLAWWEGGEIIGGRDVAAGGTWLGSSRNGRVAFLTNVLELHSLSDSRSRGDLVVRYLQSSKTCLEFTEEVVLEADEYNGFNLIMVDLCSMVMVHVTNRPRDSNIFVTKVSPGIHVLSNASLDTPWPKAQRLRYNFEAFLDKFGQDEIIIKEMAEKLMRDTVKNDETILPPIFPPECEYKMSSIFVEAAETPEGRCGTRNISALAVKTSGDMSYYESYLESNSWKEETMTYQISKLK